jgi:isopentenyl phosphate kinase
MLFVNNILKNMHTKFFIHHRTRLLVESAAETIYKIGFSAINGFDFSMELVRKIIIGVDGAATFLAVHSLYFFLLIINHNRARVEGILNLYPKQKMKNDITILKIGGSSITDKAREETLDQASLEWFARLIASYVSASTTLGPNHKIIVIHGAGSFGHHSAKRYGLRCGKSVILDESTSYPRSDVSDVDLQYQMEGLSKTRHSVQKLNSAVVGALLHHGVNAVGISPGMNISSIRAHGATKCNDEVDDSHQGMKLLCQSIHQSLEAGLVPVIHGDACLLYDGKRAGILGGDTLVEGIATLWDESIGTAAAGARLCSISRVIFITDVAGVFTADPKSDENAVLIRHLKVDSTGEVHAINDEGGSAQSETLLDISGSSHAHDVTGGLKVSSGGY